MNRNFTLEVVTPERMVLKEEINSLVVPASEGSLGILYNHVPLITNLVAGVVRYKKDKEEHYLAISCGFLEVKNNRVTILADTCERPEEIDCKRAEAAIKRAVNRLNESIPGLDVAKAEFALRRSRARLKALEYNHSLLSNKK